MAFNINNFKAIVNRYGGLQKSTNFDVMITVPFYSAVVADLRFFAESAMFPGIGFSTNDIKHLGFGLTHSTPQGVNFENMTVNFLADNKGEVRQFFEQWTNRIHNHNYTRFTSPGNLPLYRHAFPEEYEGTVDIRAFDDTGEQTRVYRLYRAYPQAIGSTQIGWEMNDTVNRIPVTFSFYSWQSEQI